jgi:SAM-dependent methyltransferase
VQPGTDLYADRARADSFGSVAQIYDSHRPRYPDAMINDLVSLNLGRVLDVGAGTGILSEQLLRQGLNVLALEPDSRMAAVARNKEIAVEMATFEAWDPAGRTFDLITFGQSFHWVNPAIALPKIHGLLHDGGRLALMWNRLVPTAPTNRDFAEIYCDYMDPDAPLTDASSKGLVETDGNISAVIASLTAAGFTAQERTYPRKARYSREQWLDLVFTYSNHLTLPDDKAAELRARLADRIGSHGVTVGGDTLLILGSRH